MGMAFARSFIQYDLVKKENLLLIEKSKERCDVLQAAREGVVVSTIHAQIGTADLVILSVKPQDFSSVARELAVHLHSEQVVLSIMAGIPMERIQRELNHGLVVRAMPNTPAMIGMGITGYTAADPGPGASSPPRAGRGQANARPSSLRWDRPGSCGSG